MRKQRCKASRELTNMRLSTRNWPKTKEKSEKTSKKESPCDRHSRCSAPTVSLWDGKFSFMCRLTSNQENLASNQQFYVKSRNLRHWPLFKRLGCRVRLQSVLSIGCGSQGGSLSVCSEVMDHSRSSGSERGKEKRNEICKNILAHRKSLLDAVE